MEAIDWTGKYIFNANGTVDPHATAENGVRSVDMSKRPLPNDLEKDDVLAVKNALELAIKPPTKNEFALIITGLTSHCGMQNKHPNAVKLMLADYWDDFGNYPKILIERACSIWRKKSSGNEWMPKSGDMINLMFSDFSKMKKQIDRVKIMLGEKSPEEQKTIGRNGIVTLGELLG